MQISFYRNENMKIMLAIIDDLCFALWDKRDKYYADNSMEKQKATQKSALSVFSVGQMLVIPYFKDIYK